MRKLAATFSPCLSGLHFGRILAPFCIPFRQSQEDNPGVGPSISSMPRYDGPFAMTRDPSRQGQCQYGAGVVPRPNDLVKLSDPSPSHKVLHISRAISRVKLSSVHGMGSSLNPQETEGTSCRYQTNTNNTRLSFSFSCPSTQDATAHGSASLSVPGPAPGEGDWLLVSTQHSMTLNDAHSVIEVIGHTRRFSILPACFQGCGGRYLLIQTWSP